MKQEYEQKKEWLQQNYRFQCEKYNTLQKKYEWAKQEYERADRDKKNKILEYENTIENYENRIQYYKTNYRKYYVIKKIQDIVDAPPDIEIKDDGTVIKGIKTSLMPYGDLTVFLTSSGKKYHRDFNCRNSYWMHPINIYQAKQQGYTACSYCCENEPNEEIPDWYKKIPEVLRIIQELEK